MADNVESLVLEHFRRLHQRLDKKDVADVEKAMCLSSIDDYLSGLMMSVSGINSGLYRMEERVGRIERRFDSTEAP